MALAVLNARSDLTRATTHEPEISYFLSEPKRASRFQVEPHQVPFSSTPGWGRDLVAVLPRAAALAASAYLRIELGVLTGDDCYVQEVGHAMIEEAELAADTETIEEVTGEYLHILNEVFTHPSEKLGEEIGAFSALADLQAFSRTARPEKPGFTQYLYVPLKFFNFRFREKAIPVVGLGRMPPKIRVKVRDWRELIVKHTGGGETTTFDTTTAPAVNIQLVVNYVHLLPTEAETFKAPMRSLYNEVQYGGPEPIAAGVAKPSTTLTLRNAVTTLVFVLQSTNRRRARQYFNYLTKSGSTYKEPLVSATLSLNAQAVGNFPLDADFLRRLLPRKHAAAAPVAEPTAAATVEANCVAAHAAGQAIYMVPFAEAPVSAWKPSGQVTFSAIPSSKLSMDIVPLNGGDSEGGGELRVYAVSQNVSLVNNGTFQKRFV